MALQMKFLLVIALSIFSTVGWAQNYEKNHGIKKSTPISISITRPTA
jgi:hypothetical protein